VPSKEPVVVPAIESNRRSIVKLPVAPPNRPVPPTMVALSTIYWPFQAKLQNILKGFYVYSLSLKVSMLKKG
jgi:hypothetical protein